MSPDHLISVIVPAYNAEPFIALALRSILSTSCTNLEVVVVDDGSTDRTATICSNFAPLVRCISQPNSGLPAARNRGLRESLGQVIGFLDADDVYVSGGLELQYQKLVANPLIDLVAGRFQNEALSSRQDEPLSFSPVDTPDEFILSLGVSLIRRSVFDKVGVFDESMRYCDDWDWFMRARELGIPMMFHRETVMRRRLHASNMTRDRNIGNAYLALMLKRSIDRRRKSSGEAVPLASLATSLEPRTKPKL